MLANICINFTIGGLCLGHTNKLINDHMTFGISMSNNIMRPMPTFKMVNKLTISVHT